MPSTLIRRTLYHDPFCVIARTGHPRLKQRLTLSCYLQLDHVLISVEGKEDGLVDRVLVRTSETRRVALRLPHFGSAALAVQNSDMICTIASTVGECARAQYGLKVFPVPMELHSNSKDSRDVAGVPLNSAQLSLGSCGFPARGAGVRAWSVRRRAQRRRHRTAKIPRPQQSKKIPGSSLEG